MAAPETPTQSTGDDRTPIPAADPLLELRQEMKAIDEIVERLVPLSNDSKQKAWRYVTDWLAKTLRTAGDTEREPPAGLASTTPSRINGAANITLGPVTSSSSSAGPTISTFGSLAELFATADPKTEAQRALVVSIWLHDHEGHTEISTQTVNRELAHLGYKVLNISRAFDSLRGSKPQLVVQLRKDGTSQQARKTYKVTVEGRKEVERMLQGGMED